MGEDRSLEARLAEWKDELRFDNLVHVHEISYKRAGGLLGKKEEALPSSDWIVTINPDTKDMNIRVAKDEEAIVEYYDSTLNQVTKTDAIQKSIEDSNRKISCLWKLHSGRPTEDTEVALMVVYLFATRHSKCIEVTNFGSASEPRYDISKAECTGGELSDKEKSFFDKIHKSEGAICFEATSLESHRLDSVAT